MSSEGRGRPRLEKPRRPGRTPRDEILDAAAELFTEHGYANTSTRRIADAVEVGKATALIVRAGDFFGPGAGSSWFSEAMVKPGRRPRAVRNPARPGIGHQWAYLPDLAEIIVQAQSSQVIDASLTTTRC